MANKGRSAETNRGQFDIAIDAEEGDEFQFVRPAQDVVAEVVQVSSSTMDYYGDEVPNWVRLEGPGGGKYLLEPSGMNANEPNAPLWHVNRWPKANENVRNMSRSDEATLISYDELRVIG